MMLTVKLVDRLGTEEVFQAEEVRKTADTIFCVTKSGQRDYDIDGGNAGTRMYVMNDAGSTVAIYHL